MRIIISGGGTGGHISPALAIADIIGDYDSKIEIVYIGSKNSLESELVPKKGLRYKTISTGYLSRRIFSLSNVKTIIHNIIGVFQALQIIRKEDPSLIIGTGGFVSGPVLLAGKLCSKPLIIHEQNAYPGITNKLLSRIADAVMISFEESKNHLTHAKKIILTGNPLRKDIFSIDRIESRKILRCSKDDFLVYSFGGSGGQLSLNNGILQLIKLIENDQNIKLIHVTGKRLYNRFMKSLKEQMTNEIPEHIRIVDYMHEAHVALNACDFIIGSGGALTLTEIATLGIPALLIPKAYTAENHQEKNARSFEKSGAAFVLTENEVTGEAIFNMITIMKHNTNKYFEMKRNMRKMGRDKTNELILSTIKECLPNNE
jgi:UDP-N-acetylglucosamine--N-acetylmuramyl-(pentapeptide) pyrophosphoryl-undecaprenol N-acetylglucosamine transferase